MHIGAPCCGMNAAVRYSTLLTEREINTELIKYFLRSFTRNCIYSGNNPIGIHNGVDGLIKVLLLGYPKFTNLT